MAKLNEMHFEFLPHQTYSTDLEPSDHYLLADIKKMLKGKRFLSNEEVIAETNAFCGGTDKSYFKKLIEMLEKRSIECITLDGDYVNE